MPKTAQEWLTEGILLLENGEYQDALKHLEQSLLLDPSLADAYLL